MFSIDDLATIFTGLKALDSISDISHTDNLISKLSTKEDKLLFKTEPILIDLVSDNKSTLSLKIKMIKSAIQKNKCIKFNYYYNKGDVSREVEPYLLVFRWSSWYMLCYCLEKNDFRLFKLNRLWNLECIEEEFEPREIPEKSVLIGDFYKNVIKVTALFDEKVKYRIIDEFGIDSIIYRDEKLLFSGEFTNRENLLSWALSFGDSIEILEPEDLKKDIIQHAKSILEKYK